MKKQLVCITLAGAMALSAVPALATGDQPPVDPIVAPVNTDTPSPWATDLVSSARSLGLIPDSLYSKFQTPITRGEFCTLAIQLIESKADKDISKVLAAKGLNPDSVSYSDTDSSDVLAATVLGIVDGVGGGKFAPDQKITREQAATMLTRLAKVCGMEQPNDQPIAFSDASSISAWAKDAVDFISACKDEIYNVKVMSGTSPTEFTPAGDCTREMAFVTMLRMRDCLPTFKLPAVTVPEKIWEAMQTALADKLVSSTSLDDELLKSYYGIKPEDLVSYVAQVPLMNVNAEEFFIAEVVPGHMDAVKAACQQRQADVSKTWEHYLPAQYELVKNYKLVTKGNFIFFGISEYADEAVTLFQANAN